MTTLPSYLIALQALVGGEIIPATKYVNAHLRVDVGPFFFTQYAGRDARYVTADRLDPATKRPSEYIDFRRAHLADDAKVTAPALAEHMGQAIAEWAGEGFTPRPDLVTQALAVAPPAIAAGIRAGLVEIRVRILARHAAELAALDAIDPKETP